MARFGNTGRPACVPPRERKPHGPPLCYSRLQIALHRIIALLIILQLGVNGAVRDAFARRTDSAEALLPAASLAHTALCAMLRLMPLTGALASPRFATLHKIGRLILVPLILAHALAALAEHFVLRNDTLRRMLHATDR